MYEKLSLLKYLLLFIIELSKTKDINKAFSIFVKNSLKEIEDDFEIEETKRELLNSLNFLTSAKKANNLEEKKQAFSDTLLLFNHPYTVTSIKFFLKLIKNDVLILNNPGTVY